jgi:rubrerythrin
MTVLTPTKDTGATAQLGPMRYVDPACQVTPDELGELLAGTGLNAVFVADLLSAVLTHERCGRHLYRTCETRSNNPMLQAKYREFGEQTERHVEILERLIGAAGGNPNYVSTHARAIEGMDSNLVMATYLGTGTLDPMVAEMAMLDAVFVAESVDHANWKALRQLADAMEPGGLRDAFQEAVDEVEREEDEHLGWASETREKLTLLQAKSTMMATAGVKAEELVARVRNWFASD